MFLVLNKEKIKSYMVSVFTVGILLGMAFYIKNRPDLLEVSSSESKLPIYNVQCEENNVALTINCAWNADDIDEILEVLEKTNTKITFFMVGDWVDKYPDAVKKISEAGHEIRKSFKYTSSCK